MDNPAMEGTETVPLPAIFDRISATALLPVLQAALANGRAVRIEGAEVMRATTPGLELLASAERSFAKAGVGFAIQVPSQALSEAAGLLGLTYLLAEEGA